MKNHSDLLPLHRESWDWAVFARYRYASTAHWIYVQADWIVLQGEQRASAGIYVVSISVTPQPRSKH